MPFTERTTSPSGSFNPCYMHRYSSADSWNDRWNNAILGGGDSGDPIQSPEYGADVLPNCVGYAVGRSLEIYNEMTGNNPSVTQLNPFNVFAGYNGEDWFTHAISLGFSVGSVPQNGAIACYYNSGVGHVAVVEYYDSQNNICRTTESGYGHYVWRQNTIRQSNNWLSDTMSSDYHFQGFIYNPSNPEPEPPTPAPAIGNKIILSGTKRRNRRRTILWSQVKMNLSHRLSHLLVKNLMTMEYHFLKILPIL